ncbi:hypothetical protein U1Q18_006074 [Sarracenia purpurea var. burkii]
MVNISLYKKNTKYNLWCQACMTQSTFHQFQSFSSDSDLKRVDIRINTPKHKLAGLDSSSSFTIIVFLAILMEINLHLFLLSCPFLSPLDFSRGDSTLFVQEILNSASTLDARSILYAGERESFKIQMIKMK